jgi:hypothetical protein
MSQELHLFNATESGKWVPDDAKPGELFLVETVGGWSIAMFVHWKYIALHTGQELPGDVLRYARLPND